MKSSFLMALILTVSIGAGLTAQTTKYQPRVGEPHPDFVLPSIEDGKPLQLSDLRGKKVLLMHFASW